jgi:probable rRNA maturation factor
MKNRVKIYLEDEQKFFESHADILEKVYKVIETCLSEEAVPFDAEISLSVMGSSEIQAINKEYRGIDKPTDVLSFPQFEPISNGKMKWGEIDSHVIILGDIILCHEKAKAQADEYGHSLSREVCFLIAHSMLHLLGYDHMNETDEKLMFDKQDYLLNLLNISR